MTVRPMSNACVMVPGTATRRTKSARIGAMARPASSPHRNTRIAREPFEPIHVHHVAEHHDVSLVVGDGGGGRFRAIDEEGGHLHLGKGAAHAVAVEHRQTSLRGGDDGFHRVGPADLGADQG